MIRPLNSSLAAPLVATFCLFATLTSQAAPSTPFTPANDSDVVERLPLSATDPSARRLQSLRKQLQAKPDDVALRLEIARRYFDLSMAQGDPRYVGYAASALAQLDKSPPVSSAALSATQTAAYWQIKGMLQQYSHNFDSALASLADPTSPDAIAWRAAIQMVQANYAKAQAECDALKPLTTPLFAAGCTQYVRASTGELQSAFDTLNAAVKAEQSAEVKASAELMLWELTRLAEMANRLQRFDDAEAYFQRALKLGLTDQFLLGAYADFLLQQKKPEAVISLLADWERSDILLLRLALAGKAANHKKAVDWANALRDRFVEAAKRGDRLHEQEAARFELDIENNPKKALALAANNYKLQKEARDAQVLLRSALAVQDAAAAQPALLWLKQSKYEDAQLAELAAGLAKLVGVK
jgi:hypothetical protein